MKPNQKLTINGRELAFDSGESILDVARRNHIDIPTLCHLKGTVAIGACRICVVDPRRIPLSLASRP